METYSFYVNGQEITTGENKSLLRFLRDDLHLTSVKDGCSEGACGTCTVVIDGIATKGCVMTTKLAQGKQILTVEGLTHEEQEAFVYAFGAVGAVQCGFCIPGMVMSGAALVRQNPNPTEDEVRWAIRGNVCRCTGYKKIIEGIQLAAAVLRGEAQIDEDLERGDDSRSSVTASTPTTSTRGTSPTWRTALPSAPSTRAPASSRSTPPRRRPCPACSACSPPRTCR